ncbi:flagellar filament capping protein FliD [Bacillus sp. AK031]
MRVGGLASGMDIDSIVADLMKAERMPLDKLKQQKQILEWKRDDYRSMNTLLLDFRSELTQMKFSSKYSARKTTSSNENLLTATATSSASQGSYNISNVTQLASAATLTNGGQISNNTLEPAKSLFSQTFSNNITWVEGAVEKQTINVAADGTTELALNVDAIDSGTLNVKVDGKNYKVVQSSTPAAGEVYLDVTNDKLVFGGTGLSQGAVVKAEFITQNRTENKTIDAAAGTWQLERGSLKSLSSFKINGATYSISDDTANNRFTIGADVGYIDKETGKVTFNAEQASGTSFEATYTQNYTSFTLGAHTSKGETSENFIVQGNQSLNTVMNKVNGSKVGLSMVYDSFSDQVTLTRTETGNYNGTETNREINTSGEFINSVLKFDANVYNSDPNKVTETGGENAQFTINGLTTERTSNTFTISGVTFTLKQTFTTGSAGISVNNDTEKVYENIKGFIEKYNELIGKISDKTSEEYYRSYKPLTDDQKESLSDKQQEKWTDMAKSGLLRRDPILSNVLSEMRMDFYQPVQNSGVSSVFNQLASIGITTTSNYLEGGKLVINETELKKAIEEDPSSVQNLFSWDGSTEEEKGIINRLYDTANNAMDKLKDKAGNAFSNNQQFAIGRNLNNMDNRIDLFEDRMKQVEDRYWRQFTAMEKAIQKANSQSAYLMQQFSGM